MTLSFWPSPSQPSGYRLCHHIPSVHAYCWGLNPESLHPGQAVFQPSYISMIPGFISFIYNYYSLKMLVVCIWCVYVCGSVSLMEHTWSHRTSVLSFRLICGKVSCLVNLDSRLVGLLTSGEFCLCLQYLGVGVQTHHIWLLWVLGIWP